MVSVAIITAAIIVILSIFNGLGDLLRSLNDSFDPEIKIEAALGKSFPVNEVLLKKVQGVQGVEAVTEVIEDYAFARYNQANQPVTIKGVSDNFITQQRIPEDKIIDGALKLRDNNINYALIGYGVGAALSIDLRNDFFPLQLYYVKNVKAGSLDPSQMYTQKNITPGGIFSIVQNFDERYIIVPLKFAEELLNYGNKRTALEIKLKKGADVTRTQRALKDVLGESFKVLNSEEQHEDLYRVLHLEKFFASIASVILLIIGSINIYFNLMMLAIDKKKDISVLAACGADAGLLKRIFIMEGILIALIGTVVGLAAGALIVFVQQKYGLVSMGMEASVVEGYPVQLKLTDFLYVSGAMLLITTLISSRPALLASRFASVQNL
ncbi:ABC transporter permease [Pseudochryseolinea flava]|uniref:ABC transporter permease n=1 Tax=Pseudochryseolinea flava TaxID=2059302 RepID=A0A364YD30_9BACT|nr:ABC transporter permease [Pseudochryseolinea flava]